MEPPSWLPNGGPLRRDADGRGLLARLSSPATLDLLRAFFDRDCTRNRRHGLSVCAFVRAVLQLLRRARSIPGDAEQLCAEARVAFARIDVHGEGLVSFAQCIEYIIYGGLDESSARVFRSPAVRRTRTELGAWQPHRPIPLSLSRRPSGSPTSPSTRCRSLSRPPNSETCRAASVMLRIPVNCTRPPRRRPPILALSPSPTRRSSLRAPPRSAGPRSRCYSRFTAARLSCRSVRLG